MKAKQNSINNQEQMILFCQQTDSFVSEILNFDIAIDDDEFALFSKAISINPNIKFIKVGSAAANNSFAKFFELMSCNKKIAATRFSQNFSRRDNPAGTINNGIYIGKNYLINIEGLINIESLDLIKDDSRNRKSIVRFLIDNPRLYKYELSPQFETNNSLEEWLIYTFLVVILPLLLLPTLIGSFSAFMAGFMYCSSRVNVTYQVSDNLSKINFLLEEAVTSDNVRGIIQLLIVDQLSSPHTIDALSNKKETIFAGLLKLLEAAKSLEEKLFIVECALDKKNALSQVLRSQRSFLGRHLFGLFDDTATMKKLLNIKSELLAQKHTQKFPLLETSFEMISSSEQSIEFN